MSDACCAPDEQNRNNLINTPPSSINPLKEVAVAMSNVKGGWFSMGSDNKNVFPGDGDVTAYRANLLLARDLLQSAYGFSDATVAAW